MPELCYLVTRTRSGAHVQLAHETAHDIESLDCWCKPARFLVCDECDRGCWKCDGGLISLTPDGARAAFGLVMVVHR